jgi:hypothetical protein
MILMGREVAREIARAPWLFADRLLPAWGSGRAAAQDQAERRHCRAWLDCGLGHYRELPPLSELTLCQSQVVMRQSEHR